MKEEQDRTYTGQAWSSVTDDKRGRDDMREEHERTGTLVVSLPLPDARRLAGRRLTIRIQEENESND